jgi:hypothetical protein
MRGQKLSTLRFRHFQEEDVVEPLQRSTPAKQRKTAPLLRRRGFRSTKRC